jgi:hypothetical protein
MFIDETLMLYSKWNVTDLSVTKEEINSRESKNKIITKNFIYNQLTLSTNSIALNKETYSFFEVYFQSK